MHKGYNHLQIHGEGLTKQPAINSQIMDLIFRQTSKRQWGWNKYLIYHPIFFCCSNTTVFSSLSFSSLPPESKSGQHLYSCDRRGFTQLPASSPCCYFRQMLLKCLASPAWNGPESKVEDYSETAENRQTTFPGQDSISLKSNRTCVCFPGTRNLSLPCTADFWSAPESQFWTCFSRTELSGCTLF